MVSAVESGLLGMLTRGGPDLASTTANMRLSFQTPEICQQIIDAFNNKTLGEDKMATTLQIRYADTEEQRKLKTYTAEKRLFKTNEYNEVVYGPGSPWRRLYSPVSNSNSSYSPIQIRAPGSNVPWSIQSQASSISPP